MFVVLLALIAFALFVAAVAALIALLIAFRQGTRMSEAVLKAAAAGGATLMVLFAGIGACAAVVAAR